MIFKESGTTPFKNTHTCIKKVMITLLLPSFEKFETIFLLLIRMYCVNNIPPSHKNVLCKQYDVDSLVFLYLNAV